MGQGLPPPHVFLYSSPDRVGAANMPCKPRGGTHTRHGPRSISAPCSRAPICRSKSRRRFGQNTKNQGRQRARGRSANGAPSPLVSIGPVRTARRCTGACMKKAKQQRIKREAHQWEKFKCDASGQRLDLLVCHFDTSLQMQRPAAPISQVQTLPSWKLHDCRPGM